MSSILETIGEFLKTPFNKYLTIALVILGLMIIANEFVFVPPLNGTLQVSDHNQSNATLLEVNFFFHPSCPHCARQKPFNEKLMVEFPQAKFIYHDVSNPKESALLEEYAKNYSLDLAQLGVPATFFGNRSFIGFDSEENSGKGLRAALFECTTACLGQKEGANETKPKVGLIDLPFWGQTDLKAYSLPLLAAILGLIDGFNPCAMWVLVYLIALVMGLNDAKRKWFIVGTFVLASGILYFLFMTAWLNAFLLVGYSRPVNILIGLIALGGGILSIKEYIDTKGALECKVTGAEEKKSTALKVQELVNAPLTIATLVSIVVLAFVVNSVEFVCSSGIPAVFTQVLALSNLSFWEYYGYILLYVLFFMLDDLIVFGLAVFAISTEAGQKYSKYCKIIGGSILLLLGLMLLFFPSWLF